MPPTLRSSSRRSIRRRCGRRSDSAHCSMRSAIAREIVAMLAQALGAFAPDHAFDEIADSAWEREWLVDFKPMRFGTRLWVCPHEHMVVSRNAIVRACSIPVSHSARVLIRPRRCASSGWMAPASAQDGDRLRLRLGHSRDRGGEARRAPCASQSITIRRRCSRRAKMRSETASDGSRHPGVRRGPATEAAAFRLMLANILALPLIELAPHFRRQWRQAEIWCCQAFWTTRRTPLPRRTPIGSAIAAPVRRDDWIRLHGVRR